MLSLLVLLSSRAIFAKAFTDVTSQTFSESDIPENYYVDDAASRAHGETEFQPSNGNYEAPSGDSYHPGLYSEQKIWDVYTACSTIGENSSWTKPTPDGSSIRAWISGIQIMVFDDEGGFGSTVKAKADKGFLISFYSKKANVRWIKHGQEKVDGWIYQEPGLKAYIYDDFSTAILGNFSKDNHHLEAGRATKIIAHKCKDGILALKFGKLSETVYTHDPMSFKPPKNPKRVEPYEFRNVYIGNSIVTGIEGQDGLFAKRNILPNSLVAVYHGQMGVSDGSEKDTTGNCCKDKDGKLNVTDYEYEQRFKNMLAFQEDTYIDLPYEFQSIVEYRGSLGHKANHQFTGVQTEFKFMNHPYYGFTRCLVSRQPIAKGEEIFVHYGYHPESTNSPQWYKDLHQMVFPNRRDDKMFYQ